MRRCAGSRLESSGQSKQRSLSHILNQSDKVGSCESRSVHGLGLLLSYLNSSGLWLSFRVLGPILGGAISLGLNAHENKKGSINPKVSAVLVVPISH